MLDDIVKVAGEQQSKSTFNLGSILAFLRKAFMTEGYGGNFKKTDNKLLGLSTSSDDFIIDQYKKLFQ